MSKPLTAARTWDLGGYFPRFDGPELSTFKSTLREDLSRRLKHAGLLPPLTDANAPAWGAEIIAFEDLATRLGHLSSYIGCLAAGDAASEMFRSEEAAVGVLGAELEKLRGEILRALQHASDKTVATLAAEPALAGLGYFIQRLRHESTLRMSTAQETPRRRPQSRRAECLEPALRHPHGQDDL